MSFLPHPPIGDLADKAVTWLTASVPDLLDGIQDAFNTLSQGLTDVLTILPALVMAVIFAVLALFVRSWKFALFVLIGMGLIISMELWLEAMQLLAMVLVATAVAVIIAIPVGILDAQSAIVSTLVHPSWGCLQPQRA